MECEECGWKAPDLAPANRHCRICGAAMIFTNTASTISSQASTIHDLLSNLDREFQSLMSSIAESQNPMRTVNISDVRKIAKLTVDPRGAALVDSVLNVQGVQFPLTLSSFSLIPQVTTTIRCNLVIGHPPHGEQVSSFQYEGSVPLLLRGKVSFAQKYLSAKHGQAPAVIVIQNENHAWPFLMTDSAKELESIEGHSDASIPVAMISYYHASLVQKMISSGRGLCAEFTIHVDVNRDCAVCRDTFLENQEVFKLDCRHCYHADCLSGWLERHSTCPLCRKEVFPPRDGTAVNLSY